MRYIGNKTNLLGFIGAFLDEAGLTGGRALDAFSGTAAVGSYLKARGFSVVGCDVMHFSYAFQRAYIVTDEPPSFRRLEEDPEFQSARSRPEFGAQVESRFHGQGELFGNSESRGYPLRPLEDVLLYLDTYLPPRTSFITEHYSGPRSGSSDDGRMYFTRQNAQRIDAIRHRVEEWRQGGVVTEDEYYVLLAALLEAADAVANTAGVYAAWIKAWQPNALRPLRLSLPPLVLGNGLQCEAHRADVNALLARLGFFDLIYLDPPYNTRQYSAYYHVPEVISRGWFDGLPELRGKTGLIEDEELKSEWSVRGTCVEALERFVSRARGRILLMSYNNEGIIPEEEIERVFRRHGVPETFGRRRMEYARYRADADREERQYKADSTVESLYYVELGSREQVSLSTRQPARAVAEGMIGRGGRHEA